MNLAGARTLFNKEILRFWKVSVQTVAAPVLTAVLYLLIFGHVLEAHVQVFPGVGYTSFLIPGLVMFSDEKNHASMIEGIRHGGGPKRIWRHNDVADLERHLQAVPRATPKIIVAVEPFW